MQLTKKSLMTAMFAAAMLSMTACGGKVEQVLKDANLQVTEQSGDKYVSMMTELNTENLIVSAVTLPVANGLGMVEILNDITSKKTFLKLTFNLGHALKFPTPTYNSKLPNGTVLPLTGIDLTKVMAFDVGNKGSKVYLYYDVATKKSVIGVALNIESLAIGTPASVLSAFDIGGVSGLAGLYFGQQENTSGLAILANLSSVFASNAAFAKANSAVGFEPLKATPAQQRRIDVKLYELSVKGTPIVVE